MVEKKSIKIFVASAAAAALVIGLSVGITENNKRQSMNASNAMAYGSQYECVESTSSQGGSKSGKSGGSKSGKSSSMGTKSSKSEGRRLVVPGTEDYYPANAYVSGRRSLQAEHVRSSRGKRGRHVLIVNVVSFFMV
jgi:hypothetical protein